MDSSLLQSYLTNVSNATNFLLEIILSLQSTPEK